jgi:hypothetical protein
VELSIVEGVHYGRDGLPWEAFFSIAQLVERRAPAPRYTQTRGDEDDEGLFLRGVCRRSSLEITAQLIAYSIETSILYEVVVHGEQES